MSFVLNLRYIEMLFVDKRKERNEVSFNKHAIVRFGTLISGRVLKPSLNEVIKELKVAYARSTSLMMLIEAAVKEEHYERLCISGATLSQRKQKLPKTGNGQTESHMNLQEMHSEIASTISSTKAIHRYKMPSLTGGQHLSIAEVDDVIVKNWVPVDPNLYTSYVIDFVNIVFV